MKETFVKISGLIPNVILFMMSVYILLYVKPVNPLALISAILCPIAMALRYRGIKLGRLFFALNGSYLLVFYSTSLLVPFITKLSLEDLTQHLLFTFLGTLSSLSLLVHCVIFDKSDNAK